MTHRLEPAPLVVEVDDRAVLDLTPLLDEIPLYHPFCCCCWLVVGLALLASVTTRPTLYPTTTAFATRLLSNVLKKLLAKFNLLPKRTKQKRPTNAWGPPKTQKSGGTKERVATTKETGSQDTEGSIFKKKQNEIMREYAVPTV